MTLIFQGSTPLASASRGTPPSVPTSSTLFFDKSSSTTLSSILEESYALLGDYESY
jgi:hypothetical protein